MRLSDLNPEDIEVVSKAESKPLRLSELRPEDIQLSQPEQPKLDVSQGEALARGVGEGLTFGFSGELMAGGKALLNPDEQSFRDRYARYKLSLIHI